MKFRKKPVVIEAIPVSEAVENADENFSHNPVWLIAAYERGEVIFFEHYIQLKTLESGGGWFTADYDDWIIRGVQGELYACKPDIFEMTYEAAE